MEAQIVVEKTKLNIPQSAIKLPGISVFGKAEFFVPRRLKWDNKTKKKEK